jgi:hypothetical protein
VKKITILAAIAVFFSGAVSWAALTPLGGEYPLVGDIAGHQQNPHVAVGPNGGYVVWQNATTESKGERILAQRLNADFKGVGGAIVISQNLAGNNEINPRVALLPNGAAVITWQSGSRSSPDIYFRVVDGAGNTSTGIQRVNTFATGIQSDADVAALAAGQVLVVWTSLGQDGDGEGIYGQRFTPAGVREGPEFLINQTTARNQSKPNVAALTGDKFVVGWVSESINGRNTSGALNLRANVMARIFHPWGTATGNEYRLNDGDVVSSEVKLAPGVEGGFVAAWVQQDETNMNNLSDVFVKAFDANGLPAKKSVRHNTFLKGRQENPALAIVGTDALVAWTSHGQDAGGAGIQGRLLSGGTEFKVNSQGNLHQRRPTAGSNGGNKYFVVWVNTIRADHSILSAQRYLASNGVSQPNVVDVTQGEVVVVGAEPERRRTNPSAGKPARAAHAPAPATPSATLNISPPPPQVATVAPRIQQEQIITVPSAPAAVSSPTSVSQSAQSTAGMAENANRGSTQLQPRATQLRNVRLNMRSPSFANTAAASQTTLMRRAQAQTFGTRSGFQSSTSAFNRAQPSANSLSRSAFLRQSLSNWSRPQPGYTRTNIRTTQQPNLRTAASSPSSRSAGVGQLRTGNMNSWDGRLGSYQRQSTRQTPTRQTPSAADRQASLLGRAQANAEMARSSGQRPVPAGITQNGQGTRLSWLSQGGARYQVQSSNNRTSWNNVGNPRSGQAGSDSIGLQSGGPKYYRVVRSN